MSGTLLTGGLNASGRQSWAHVIARFSGCLNSLAITQAQFADGCTKQAGVRDCLNQHYYGYASETANSGLTGSWGKQLQVRPPRDIDVLFALPVEVYNRFELRAGNKQTQLLQEVKRVLASKYYYTDMRGDGQVIVVQFATTPVEVVPAFLLESGQFWICNTRGDGSYITTDPNAEIAELEESDSANSGATRHLIRLLKQWQRHCDVPIKSFMLERAAVEFLRQWDGVRDLFWYDWLVRDFLAYLIARADGVLLMPGTLNPSFLGRAWLSKAKSAHASAVRACDHERQNDNLLAGLYWKDLFGNMISAQA